MRYAVLVVCVTLALASGPTVPVAPGVNMPFVSLGTGSGQKGDVVNATALWVQAGGVGIDTAYDYMDESDIARGLKIAGKSPSSMFILLSQSVQGLLGSLARRHCGKSQPKFQQSRKGVLAKTLALG